MAYESNTPHLVRLVERLAPPGKRAEVRAALKAAADQPKPPVPPGAPPPPTDPSGPFGADNSASTARFIVEANERRIAKCPPAAPTGADEASQTAAFIIAANERRLGRAS